MEREKMYAILLHAREGVAMTGRRLGVALIATTLLVLSDGLGASQPEGPAGPSASTTQITFAGRVVDSQGRSVEGARVTLYGMAYAEEASLPKVVAIQEKVTGADGAFSLSSSQGASPYGPGFLLACKEGLAMGWATCQRQAGQWYDITLGKPTSLAGDVVDEKGVPISDAEVSIAFATIGNDVDRQILVAPGSLYVKTDNRGHFLLENLPAGATCEFLVRKPGRVTLNTLIPTLFGDSSSRLDIARLISGPSRCQFSPGQTGIKLALPLEAIIEGRAVEKNNGRPISGVKVTAKSDQPQTGLMSPDPVTTAEDGGFRIGGLAAGNGSVQLAATRGRVAEWVADPVPLSLTAGKTNRDVKLELIKGGIIEILVKDADGKPVGQAAVRITHAQRQQYFGGSTNADGFIHIRVPPGQYHVSEPFKLGYALQIKREQVAVEEGETKRVELVLSVAPRVAGTVRDGAGNLLGGVRIVVTPPGILGVVTNVDGGFVLDWNPKLLGVLSMTPVLVARDVARNLAEAREIDEQTRKLDLTLKPAVIFAGTVLSQEGKPLSDARILVGLRQSGRDTSLGLIEQVAAGEQGTFEIPAIPPGRPCVLMATASGYVTHLVSIDASNVKGGRQVVGPFKLLSADLSISGMVVDSQDRPVVGATVTVMDGSLPPRDDVWTDADGKFVIKGIPAGSILLMAGTRGPRYMHGAVEAKGGATDVRIVVSE
jgi:protocatechuate 3,4-dioxygenase beta subunit